MPTFLTALCSLLSWLYLSMRRPKVLPDSSFIPQRRGDLNARGLFWANSCQLRACLLWWWFGRGMLSPLLEPTPCFLRCQSVAWNELVADGRALGRVTVQSGGRGLQTWLAVWLAGRLIHSRAARLAVRLADTSLQRSDEWGGVFTVDTLAKVALGLRRMWGFKIHKALV